MFTEFKSLHDFLFSWWRENPCVLNLGLDLPYGSLYEFPTFSEEAKTLTVSKTRTKMISSYLILMCNSIVLRMYKQKLSAY